MKKMGKPPDPLQKEILLTRDSFILNCCRQWGKSTVAGVKAAHRAVFFPKSLIVIVSKSQRQAGETFRKALDAYYAMGSPVAMVNLSTLYAEFENGSRIISLPGKEGTIRGYSAVSLLLIDEASRVPEDIYRAVRPMLAVSQGQLGIMSTPFGIRGFFHKEWMNETNGLKKYKASADSIPERIPPWFLASEKASLGESYYLQEYFNSFTSVEGLVYPKFRDCIVDEWPHPHGRIIGGIDWGWRDPFAAIWGIRDDATDTLWLRGEHYKRGELLTNARNAIKPLNASWAADPSGATQIMEFRSSDITVYKGNNDIEAGVAAVTARMETGRLKIFRPGCPNLIEELGLYRYPEKKEFSPTPEKPIDEYNHAPDALRYLVALLDRKFMAHYRKKGMSPDLPPQVEPVAKRKPTPWDKLRSPAYQWKVVG